MPSIRQRFHLSPCSDFRSHFCGTIIAAGDWIIYPKKLPTTSVTLSHLTKGVKYDFQVRAVTSAGQSAWSEVVSQTQR